ncbi:TPA: hypothetical protein ACSC6M_004272 [Enterobacter roggenkampii]|nr:MULTISPECIES: hypothetical protein [Enterobacter cloacae complex]MCW4840813.1 hypothetical protein [Enterobacter hormaechei subsp. xiangfangensis]MDO2402255.1 hypothetical protein [Enterobacter hormaechei]MDO2406817.1 hypothetical protein [Enterobacter hormaechei]MDO2421054.1 hypothetical protein [Enterobacter hormaechei]MDW2631821.1 hypothetical protein [Enterobacter hormaechei]
MNNLSLTTAEFARLIKVFGWLLGGLCLLLFFVQWHYFYVSVLSALFKALGWSMTGCIILLGVFTKLAWRCEKLAYLMKRPVVHGIWHGELKSDFGTVDNAPLVVPIFFVIRQTYLTLSIQSFTERQDGESRLEALLKSDKTNDVRLCYIFELRKLFSGASSLTSGAGELKLSGDQAYLSGKYWTNTPTHGDINLKLISRDCKGVSSYNDVQKKIQKISDKR